MAAPQKKDGKIANAKEWPSGFLTWHAGIDYWSWQNFSNTTPATKGWRFRILYQELDNIPFVDADINWIISNINVRTVYSWTRLPTNAQVKGEKLIGKVVGELGKKNPTEYSKAENDFIKKYENHIQSKHSSFHQTWITSASGASSDAKGLLAAAGATTEEFDRTVMEHANKIISQRKKELADYAFIELSEASISSGITGFKLFLGRKGGAAPKEVSEYQDKPAPTPEDRENYKLIKNFEYHKTQLDFTKVAPVSDTPPIDNLSSYKDTWKGMWSKVKSTTEKQKGFWAKYVTGGSIITQDLPNIFVDDPNARRAAKFKNVIDFAEDKERTIRALRPNASDAELLPLLQSTIKVQLNIEAEATAKIYAGQQLAFYQIYYVTVTYQNFVDLHQKNKKALAAGKDPSNAADAKAFFESQKKKVRDKIVSAHKEVQQEIAANKATIDAPKLSKKEIESVQRANMQCALLMNLHPGGGHKGLVPADFKNKFYGGGKRPNKKDNIRVWLGAKNKDCNQIIGKLLGKKKNKLDPFLNITPDVVSAMVPMVRLYKVKSSGTKLVESEFAFDMHTNQNPDRKLTFDDIDRGDGVGLKEFSFSFHGGNPAMSRKDIKAKLVMYFQSFSDFLGDRRGGSGNKYRFVDLLLFGMPAKKKIGFGKYSINQYDPSYYRIRADVGWFIRSDREFKDMLKNRQMSGEASVSALKSFSNALKEINQSFYLNMIEHNIDVRPDGSIMVTAEYQAYIESATKTNVLDALSDETLIRQRESLNHQVESVLYTCNQNLQGGGASDIQNLINVAEVLEEKYLEGAYQSIMTRLIKRGLVYRKYIKKEFLNPLEPGKWTKRPGLIDPGTAKAQIKKENNGAADKTKKKQEAAKDAAKNTTKKVKETFEEFSMLSPDSSLVQLNYFYISDLVDVVLDCKKDRRRPEFKKTKVVLGSFTHDGRTINIGEIPVSTNYFFEWLTDNVISKGLKTFPLMNFIRSLTNNLINDMLNERCFATKSDMSVEFRTTTALSVKPLPWKSGAFKLDLSGGGHSLKSFIPEGKSSNDVYHYIIIYAMKTGKDKEKIGRGNAKEDGRNGIHHLQFGQNRGIVKKISFEKTDIPYSREARYFRHGFDGLAQIGAVYNAKIEMIGNTIFYPGMMLYLDPRGIGGRKFDPTVVRSDANTLGFGGYHVVTKVDSSITPEGYKTTVTAMWNYTGERESKVGGKPSTSKKQNHYLEPVGSGKCGKLTAKIENAVQKWNKGDRKNLLK